MSEAHATMPDIEAVTADEIQRRRVRIDRLASEEEAVDARIEVLVEVREQLRSELVELRELEDQRSEEELAVPDDMLAQAPVSPRLLLIPEADIIAIARRLMSFTLPELAAPLGVKVNKLKGPVAGLCECGKLRATKQKFYGRPVYEYVAPEDAGAAFERQERLGAELPGRNGNGGQPVAHTGKPMGASGKPGRDRALARQGRRIKTKHGKA